MEAEREEVTYPGSQLVGVGLGKMIYLCELSSCVLGLFSPSERSEVVI